MAKVVPTPVTSAAAGADGSAELESRPPPLAPSSAWGDSAQSAGAKGVVAASDGAGGPERQGKQKAAELQRAAGSNDSQAAVYMGSSKHTAKQRLMYLVLLTLACVVVTALASGPIALLYWALSRAISVACVHISTLAVLIATPMVEVTMIFYVAGGINSSKTEVSARRRLC